VPWTQAVGSVTGSAHATGRWRRAGPSDPWTSGTRPACVFQGKSKHFPTTANINEILYPTKYHQTPFNGSKRKHCRISPHGAWNR
jgi:hypothetical protein